MKLSIRRLGPVALVARTSARTKGLALSCFAAMCGVLGLAGSGFDYSVANAAAAVSEDAMAGGVDLLAWNGFLGNVLLGSLGAFLAAVLVLALSLWTAPPVSAKFVPPQRQLYDAAD